MAALSPNLDAILADLRPAAQRLAAGRQRRRRVTRTAMVGAAGACLLASAALGATAILGQPAPESVKRDFRAVDEGMPADLRANPDVEHARAVAVSGDSTVYFAQLADGGYCAELVTGDRPRGAVCSSTEQSAKTPLSVTVPYTDPVTASSPVRVSGHVSLADAKTVQLVYPDGGVDEVALSPDRFYVADVPQGHLAAVHRHGLLLIARSEDGGALAQAVVSHDAITPPSEAERPHDPIEIDTISDGGDFTKVLGMRGEVRIPGATRLRLRYPDGHSVAVPSFDGRRFEIDVPPDRESDFADATGAILAFDSTGRQVGERAVYSVGRWHRRHGG
jgi:hypothetical protein